jgi:hypothetical protein
VIGRPAYRYGTEQFTSKAIPAEDHGAERLGCVVAALGVPHGFERSIKLRDGVVQPNRCLLTIAKASGARPDALVDAWRALAMPAPLLERARARLADADLVHFGYEQETDDRSFYKVYLEFRDRFEPVPSPAPDGRDPFPLHLAFKWNPRDAGEAVEGRYLCYGPLDSGAILRRLARVYAQQPRRTTWDLTCGLLATAARRVDARDLLYLDVEEAGTARRSFDLKLYPAGLSMAAVASSSAALSAHFGIAAGILDTALAPHRSARLGHVSGGMDRRGRDFFTVYFGVEARA